MLDSQAKNAFHDFLVHSSTLAALDFVHVSNDELCQVLLGVEEARKQLDAFSARVLVEAERREVTNVEHGLSTGTWVAREANVSRRGTRFRLHVAKKLASHFHEVLDAVQSGGLSWQHGEVIAQAATPRVIDQLAEITPELVKLATALPFENWSREVRNIVQAIDHNNGYTPGDDVGDNKLHISELTNNTISFTGQLCGELGLKFRDAISLQANVLFHRFKREADSTSGEIQVPNHQTLQALALVELLTCSSGGNADVSLVINASNPEHVTDKQGVIIGNTNSFTTLCDPVFTPIVTDVRGVVINLGQKQRLASQAQRTALAHRDGGCVFPGCDAPADWTDLHHIQHWMDGGPTDLSNLASLCRHHHMVSHRKGWRMSITPDQWFTWVTPTGQVLNSQRHGRSRFAPELVGVNTDKPPG